MAPLTEKQVKSARVEAKSFSPPKSFSGGCMKSKSNRVCFHFRTDGSLGKIQHGCKEYDRCIGFDFKYFGE